MMFAPAGMPVGAHIAARAAGLKRFKPQVLKNLPKIHQRQARLTWIPPHLCHARGLATKTTISVEDLPQGVLSDPVSKETPSPEPATSYPTVIQQARNNMRKFENCVLLTRVGGFYELYFEQAEKYGPLLNLKVAKKSTSAGPVPMAGFPFFQLDRFLRTLIQDLEKAVAISEEFPNNAAKKARNGGLLFDRRVARIVTPGTLVDEKFMDPYENNFLLAVHVPNTSLPTDRNQHSLSDTYRTEGDLQALGDVGLAWLDLSTGEFFTQSAPAGTVAAASARIGAKETVIDSEMSELAQSEVQKAMLFETLVPWKRQSTDTATTEWSSLFDSAAVHVDNANFTKQEIGAALVLLDYVRDRLQGIPAKLQPPVKWHEAQNMSIDANTMKGLEILETSRDAISGGKGSLLHSLRRTVSSGGARLLRSRLSSPSTSLATINYRLDLVECFIKNREQRESLTELLQKTCDTQRLVQKFSLGRGDADDLISLHKTISATRSIKTILEGMVATLKNEGRDDKLTLALSELIRRISMTDVDELASSIAQAIDEDSLLDYHRSEEEQATATLAMAREVMASEGGEEDLDALPRTAKGKAAVISNRPLESLQSDSWKMRKSANPMLGKLHAELDDLFRKKAELENELRDTSQASSLTLRWTPGQGHICHVKGTKDVKASMETIPTARNAGTSKSTRSFYHSSWTKLGTKIDQQKFRIIAEEDNLFAELRAAVVRNLVRLRRNAAVLDEIDVACASATTAEEEILVRPILNDSTSHNVVSGRHATVKLGLDEQGRAFVSNDCSVGTEHLAWLITGPNMAGKSTFLRQNALLSILAQVGLFVPAEYAEIGIVDHVFSRIGSADNLYRDQSTFMVEMLESAHILRTATPRSLVIMDEIGRGTTPEDGMAVAFACLHHLYHVNRCRTLFATHFHALADMTEGWERLGRYCTDIAESSNGRFHYDYRLRPGVNRNSHALKVARLAGMPAKVIDIARAVLDDEPLQEEREIRKTAVAQ